MFATHLLRTQQEKIFPEQVNTTTELLSSKCRICWRLVLGQEQGESCVHHCCGRSRSGRKGPWGEGLTAAASLQAPDHHHPPTTALTWSKGAMGAHTASPGTAPACWSLQDAWWCQAVGSATRVSPAQQLPSQEWPQGCTKATQQSLCPWPLHRIFWEQSYWNLQWINLITCTSTLCTSPIVSCSGLQLGCEQTMAPTPTALSLMIPNGIPRSCPGHPWPPEQGVR